MFNDPWFLSAALLKGLKWNVSYHWNHQSQYDGKNKYTCIYYIYKYILYLDLKSENKKIKRRSAIFNLNKRFT